MVFNTDLNKNPTISLKRKALSNHHIQNPKYDDTWDVGIMFDYWRERGANSNLKNVEL
jgi:hypothetical protein